jgi:hypothetical protein
MKNVCIIGSCRLQTTIQTGWHHFLEESTKEKFNFLGIGKLHNTKQVIQFHSWLMGNEVLPDDIINDCFMAHSQWSKAGSFYFEERNFTKYLEPLKIRYESCSYFLIEICSLKLYMRSKFHVQFQQTENYSITEQNSEDILKDLKQLCDLIGNEKKIIIQTHFRPNVIYDDIGKAIEKRELIFNIVRDFCQNNVNVSHHDPSEIIKVNPQKYFDGDTHFTHEGYFANFSYIYEHYLA